MAVKLAGGGSGHVLISGRSGAGKSSTIGAILAGLAPLRNVEIIGIDPKRLELTAWSPRLAALAVTPDETTKVLTRLMGELDRRRDTIAGRKLVRPTAAMPWLVVVVDELAAVTSNRANTAKLQRVALEGRALGVSLVLACQVADAATVGSAIRAQIGTVLAHKCRDRTQSDMALGAGDGPRPHELPERPGIGIIDDGRPRVFRSFHVTEKQAQQIAETSRRPHAQDPLSQADPMSQADPLSGMVESTAKTGPISRVSRRIQPPATTQNQTKQSAQTGADKRGKPRAYDQPQRNEKQTKPRASTIARQLRDNGASFQAIANELNRRGTPTRTGAGKWWPASVREVLENTHA